MVDLPHSDSAENQTESGVPESDLGPLPSENSEAEQGFTGEDLELAYQRALESVETYEPAMPTDDSTSQLEPAASSELATSSASESSSDEIVSSTDANLQPLITEQLEPIAVDSSTTEEMSLFEPATATIPMSAAPSKAVRGSEKSEETRVTPAHVLEAVLFVGGPPLTAKKLAGLLRGSSDVTAVERIIDELNQEYAVQNRPYEIRLGDGGYRIDLRPEYERLRQRVFGGGPREVRLSQELLEILALVAYKQPISVADIEELGRKGPEAHLRQLLRRELIALRRSETNSKEVRYHTTSRFLSLFGLGSLDELPQPEDVELK